MKPPKQILYESGLDDNQIEAIEALILEKLEKHEELMHLLKN